MRRYGFFKNKRIVLYDTLIEQCKEPEVVAVLAHELGMSPSFPARVYECLPDWRCQKCTLHAGCFIHKKRTSETAVAVAGHWKMGHTIKNLVVTQIQTLATFVLFSLVRSSKGLFTSFGFTKSQPAIIAYTLFSIISAPLSEVALWLHHAFKNV